MYSNNRLLFNNLRALPCVVTCARQCVSANVPAQAPSMLTLHRPIVSANDLRQPMRLTGARDNIRVDDTVVHYRFVRQHAYFKSTNAKHRSITHTCFKTSDALCRSNCDRCGRNSCTLSLRASTYLSQIDCRAALVDLRHVWTVQ